MKIRSLLAGMALSITACSGPADISKLPDEPAADPTYTLREQQAWAGGTIQIEAMGVTKAHGTLEARVGNLPASIARMTGSTYVLEVPRQSSGSQPVTIVAGPESFDAGILSIAGFDSWGSIPIAITSYSMVPLDDPTDAVVVAASSSGLELINLSKGTNTTFPAYQPARMVAPGQSYRPGIVLAEDDQQIVHALEHDPVADGFVALGPIERGGGVRHLMEIGPHVFMWLGNHQGEIQRLPGAAAVDDPMPPFQVEDADAVVMSPARNRATIQPSAINEGLPVFTAPEGELAYRIADVIFLDRVAFSPDGSRLAVVYKPNQGIGGRELRVYDALTGTPIGQRPLDDTDLVFGLLFDPHRPLLYIASSDWETGRVTVQVRHATDLGLAGRLEAPEGTPGCGFSTCYSAALAASSEPAVYFAYNGITDAGTQLAVLRFTVSPE